MPAPRFADWFTYFPSDYRWSAALDLVLGSAPYGGAELGEVDAVGRALRRRVGDDDAWFGEWTAMADRVRADADDARAAGHELTAADWYLRACTYYQIGERFRLPKDERALTVYRRSLECFRHFAALTDGPVIEPVEVPYGSASLPAYFVRGRQNPAPAPCVVYFDGLDITKELQFLRGPAELIRRGMSCLLVDGPGNGESIRLRGLPLVADYERAGSAALDYLSARQDTDPGRVAVMAISLGGYYASRCASLEPRFAAAVAWGAIWDYQETWRARIARSFQTSLSVAGEHIAWVLGAADVQEALAALAGYRLDGVVQQMRCPFLLLHGEHDEQVPLRDAQALLGAVGSADKTLRLFAGGRGGATHCQNDALTLGTVAIADWLADRLGKGARA